MSTLGDRYLLTSATLAISVQALQYSIRHFHSFLFKYVYPNPHQRLQQVQFQRKDGSLQHTLSGTRLSAVVLYLNMFTLIGFSALSFFPATIALSVKIGAFQTLVFILGASTVFFVTDTFPSPRCDGSRTSFIAFTAHWLNAIAALIILNIKGLDILEPPDETTTGSLDSTDLSFNLDSYFVLVFLLLFSSFPRFVYEGIFKQILGMTAHILFNACLWYLWRTSSSAGNGIYFHYIALKVWTGRHVLFLLHIQVTIQQHSMTVRKLPFASRSNSNDSRDSNPSDELSSDTRISLEQSMHNNELNSNENDNSVSPVEECFGSHERTRGVNFTKLLMESVNENINGAKERIVSIQNEAIYAQRISICTFVVLSFSDQEIKFQRDRLDMLANFISELGEDFVEDSPRHMAFKKLDSALNGYNEALRQEGLHGDSIPRFRAQRTLGMSSRELSKAIRAMQSTVTFQKETLLNSGKCVMTIIDFGGCNKQVQEFFRNSKSVYEKRILSRLLPPSYSDAYL